MVVNPYQSVAPVVDCRTKLEFDSVIELSDYAALLPHRDSEAILIRILFGLLVFISLAIAAAIIARLVWRGWIASMVPPAILSIAMLMGAVYLTRYTRSQRRARRLLKGNPDLLSPARGELTPSGISFHDGARQHWFGPQYLVNAVVSKVGLRVYVDQNAYRYLAHTSRMFEGYDVSLANRLKQNWVDAAARVTDPVVPAGLEAWTALNPTPDDAIAFAGRVTQSQSMRTPDVRKNAIIESVSIVCLIWIAVAVQNADFPWVAYGATGYTIIATCLTVKRWWQYFYGESVNAWIQRGWISPREFAILRGNRGVRMPLREMTSCVDHGGVLEISTLGGGTVLIARDHVASDADWTRIINGCQAMLKREALAERPCDPLK